MAFLKDEIFSLRCNVGHNLALSKLCLILGSRMVKTVTQTLIRVFPFFNLFILGLFGHLFGTTAAHSFTPFGSHAGHSLAWEHK